MPESKRRFRFQFLHLISWRQVLSYEEFLDLYTEIVVNMRHSVVRKRYGIPMCSVLLIDEERVAFFLNS